MNDYIEKRVNNSGSKTLLENWVEERACKKYEEPSEKILKFGHKGILSTTFASKVENLTTTKSSYQKPERYSARLKGKKLELLEKQLIEKIRTEKVELERPKSPHEYMSVTKNDFAKEFLPQQKIPEQAHDVNLESAVTFWSETHHITQGVTQVRTRDTPFRKNTAFSTPVEEYYNTAKPYDQWEFDGV